MSKVLAYTSPALGHLGPMMPLLLELRDRGHEVHVRTLGTMVEQVRAAGIHAEPIDETILLLAEKYPDWEAKNTREALANSAGLFTERAHLDGPDLQRAIAQVDPDLLMVDTNCWGALCAAVADPRPAVQVAPYLVPLRSAGMPPFGPGLPRWDNPVGRLRDAVVGRLVFGAVSGAFLPRVNAVRAEWNLPPVASMDEFTLATDLLLITTSPPFDYPHPDWPSQVRSIGAMSWEPATEEPDWLADLADPVTLVTTSSEYQADEALARAAIEGLGDQPGSVVVTMPAGVPADLGPLPANVRVAQFVSHRAVLARAAVAVTHGGMGATQKALAAGVPVCVVPFGRDQKETAARVVYADAGVRLPVARLTPDRLRQAVRLAATKSAGAARCAAGFEAAGGVMAGVDAVEELLTTRQATAC